MSIWSDQRIQYENCNFISNTGGPKGVVSISQCQDCTFRECLFEGCVSGQGGVVFLTTGSIERLTFEECIFDRCTAASSSSVFTSSSCKAVTFEHCIFIDCQGGDGLTGAASVLDVTCESLTFRFNTFNLSLGESINNGIKLRTTNSELRVENCSFSNSQQQIFDNYLTLDSSNVVVVNSQFDEIGTWSKCSGVSYRTNNGHLEISNCQFTNLVSNNEGTAVYVERGQVEISSCEIISCRSESGGSFGGCAGIVIQSNVGSARLLDCTFQRNQCPGSGQSLFIVSNEENPYDRVTLEQCKFSNHQKDSIIAFVQVRDSAVVSFAGTYLIADCTFSDNAFDQGTKGIFEGRCEGVLYEHCIFTGSNSGSGLISIGDENTNCSLRDCNFTGSFPPTAGILFSPEGSACTALIIESCDFDSCQGKILNVVKQLSYLLLRNVHFTDCHSSDGALLRIGQDENRINCIEAVIEDMNLLDCTRGGNQPVFDVLATTLHCDSNVFNLSIQETVSTAVKFEINTKSNILEIENCNFSNKGNYVSERFITIPDAHQHVAFHNCQFDALCCKKGGGGLRIALGENGRLDVLGCTFSECRCKFDGGAIHTQSTGTVNIENCTFDGCCADEGYNTIGGGGGVNIDAQTRDATLTHCTFINCESPQNGQSLHVRWTQGGQRNLDFFDCNFTSHHTMSIVVFLCTNDDTVEDFQGEYVLSFCNFVQNTFDKESDLNSFGVFHGNSRTIRYENCTFSHNTIATPFNGIGFVVVGSIQSSCSLIDCGFEEPDLSQAAGLIGFATEGSTADINIKSCEFTDCAVSDSLIPITSSRCASLIVSETTFSGCSCLSAKSGSVLSIDRTLTISTVRFINNKCTNCKGAYNGIAVMSLAVGKYDTTFEMTGNEFTTSAESEKCCLSLIVEGFATCEISHCIFDNSGRQFGDQQAQFIDFGVAAKTLRLTNCSFQNIKTRSDGGGLYTPRQGNPTTLEMTLCKFTSLSSECTGGVYSGKSDRLDMNECTFESCESTGFQGGYRKCGGLYIDSVTETATIRQCVFKKNSNSDSGQSLYVERENKGMEGITLSDCSFEDHTGTSSLLCFVRSDNSPYPGVWTISDCNFTNNALRALNGFIKVESEQEIEYHQCRFMNNGNRGGLISLAISESLQSCKIVQCLFDNSDYTGQVKCVLDLQTGSGVLQELEISDCTFIEVNTEAGIVSFPTNRATTLAGATTCKSMRVAECEFIKCSSAQASILEMNCEDAYMTQNTFSADSQSTSVRMSITGSASKIEDTLFTVATSLSSPMFDIVLASNSQLQFYNCCFARSPETSVPVYLSLSGTGSVSFSSVCFDGERSSVQASNEVSVKFDRNPDEFFGEQCICWAIVTASEELTVTDVPESVTATETSSEAEPSITESSASVGPEPDPGDSGSGSKVNGGLIAGVVIGIIIVIVVVILVVLLLLRRRKAQQSEGEATGDQEFTEETITTVAETKAPVEGSEWSQTTEDNPLFTAESWDNESPFANAFEEAGFGE